MPGVGTAIGFGLFRISLGLLAFFPICWRESEGERANRLFPWAAYILAAECGVSCTQGIDGARGSVALGVRINIGFLRFSLWI